MKDDRQTPVYRATFDDVVVRFYPPQSDTDMMPWVAAEDLAHAMGCTNRETLSRIALDEGPDYAKRIRTEDGTLTCVLAFPIVNCILQNFVNRGWLSEEGSLFPFREEALLAAAQIYPALFARNENGETVIHRHSLPILRSKRHEAVVNLLTELGGDGVVTEIVQRLV